MSTPPSMHTALYRELDKLNRKRDKINERQDALSKESQETWDKILAVLGTIVVYAKAEKLAGLERERAEKQRLEQEEKT